MLAMPSEILQVTPAMWFIGVLITILIAVLTVIGGLLKVTYDASQRLGVTLYGNERADDIGGFLDKSRARQKKLAKEHEDVYEQLLMQARLLSELTYAFTEIAEELNNEDDVEVDIDVDRIERIREEKDDFGPGDL